MLLTDFPVALLQPLFRAMPALAHAAPAASAAGAWTLGRSCLGQLKGGAVFRTETASLRGICSAVTESLPGEPLGRRCSDGPHFLTCGRPGRRQQQQRAGRPGALLRAQQRPARQRRRIHRLPRQRPAVRARDCGCAVARPPSGPRLFVARSPTKRARQVLGGERPACITPSSCSSECTARDRTEAWMVACAALMCCHHCVNAGGTVSAVQCNLSAPIWSWCQRHESPVHMLVHDAFKLPQVMA